MSPPDEIPEAASQREPGFDSETIQAEFEIEFFGRVLQRNPDQVDALRRQAELFATRGDYQQALNLDRRLVKLLPGCCLVRYNLACSLAMSGNTDEAVQTLQAAIERGYCDFAHMESDADLEPLRDHPGYVSLLARHGIDT